MMHAHKNWQLGRGPSFELIRYEPEQEPPLEDIEQFVGGTKVRIRLLPLQSSRFVLRETRQTLSWLTSYIKSESEHLRTNFVREVKSFYEVFLEHPDTGDRAVSFRLTTAGLDGHTEWRVSLRRVRFQGDDEHFLCAEY